MFHLAQVNIGRMRGELESAVMAGFVARLDEINALADCSPGFVWRLQTEAGNATYLRPYDDARILFNLSVWQDLPSLKDYVYRTAHAELLRDRRNWFEHSPARTPGCGGCRQATSLASTKRNGGSATSKSTAPRSSPSRSR